MKINPTALNFRIFRVEIVYLEIASQIFKGLKSLTKTTVNKENLPFYFKNNL